MALTKEERIRRQVRRDCEDEVRSSGKFGGEDRYVPYFYSQSLEGCQSEDWGDVQEGGWFARFDLDEEDRLRFPELKGREYVTIMEDSQGFVSEVDDRGPYEELTAGDEGGAW